MNVFFDADFEHPTCKGKSTPPFYTFALSGRMLDSLHTLRAMPWAGNLLGFTFPLRAGDFQFSPFEAKSETLVTIVAPVLL